MGALDRDSTVTEQLIRHFETLAEDLEMMGPSVELIMASVTYTMRLIDEHDLIAASQLERVERARRRLIEALTSVGDLRYRAPCAVDSGRT